MGLVFFRGVPDPELRRKDRTVRSRLNRVCRLATAVATMAGVSVLAGSVGPGAHVPAAAAAPCTTTPSTLPGISILDPSCGFSPSPNALGALSTVFTGILPDNPAGGLPGGESAYRVEVPPNWNGSLVMYAHGFRGTGSTVFVDNPEL